MPVLRESNQVDSSRVRLRVKQNNSSPASVVGMGLQDSKWRDVFRLLVSHLMALSTGREGVVETERGSLGNGAIEKGRSRDQPMLVSDETILNPSDDHGRWEAVTCTERIEPGKWSRSGGAEWL